MTQNDFCLHCRAKRFSVVDESACPTLQSVCVGEELLGNLYSLDQTEAVHCTYAAFSVWREERDSMQQEEGGEECLVWQERESSLVSEGGREGLCLSRRREGQRGVSLLREGRKTGWVGEGESFKRTGASDGGKSWQAREGGKEDVCQLKLR